MIAGLRPEPITCTSPFSSSLRLSFRLLLSLSLALAAAVGTVERVVAADLAPLDEQLSARGIRDARVLGAFAAVPRDVFVPPESPERVFDDKPLPPGFKQIISQPYLLARMIEALQLKPEARVLEVGTGTGYPAAILSEVAQEVFSVGVIPEMAATARLRLTREGHQNVHIKLGDPALGWREYGPYDAIVVTSIGARVPPGLVEQLVEGGALVMVVGPARGRQVLIRGVKKGFKLHAKELAELHAAPNDDRPVSTDGKRQPPTVKERRPAPDSDDPRSDR